MRDLIARLARPMLRLTGRGERGTVGVLVAVLAGGGVLLGIGALAVDVGQLYQNRAELQNGADAAALAVAKSCVSGTCAPSVAAQYADANASKLTAGEAAVPLVCGSGTLGACPASTGTMTDCPAVPPNGTNFVDVHTATKTPSGSVLPPVFARTLPGNSGYQGTTVLACAQAEWGAPTSANTVAFTISACEWDQATKQGTSFAPPPPYPPNPLPGPSFDQVLMLHGSSGDKNTNTGCPTEPAGADGPGNFGWTDDSGNCSVTISGSSYGGSTGTSISQDCATALRSDWLNKTLVFVPVYISVSGPGTNSSYTLKGFAAFVITGYHLPAVQGNLQAPDWLNPRNDCHGNDFCINGYFTQGLIPSTGGLGGKNLGAYIIKLTG